MCRHEPPDVGPDGVLAGGEMPQESFVKVVFHRGFPKDGRQESASNLPRAKNFYGRRVKNNGLAQI